MNNNTLTVDYRKIEDLFSEIEEMKFELEGIVFAAKVYGAYFVACQPTGTTDAERWLR
jgi:hypothetical protein